MTKRSQKSRKTSTQRAPNRPRVTKYSPEKAEARDEGPRLIPLPSRREEHPMQYYVDLGDQALGLRKPEPRRNRLKRS